MVAGHISRQCLLSPRCVCVSWQPMAHISQCTACYSFGWVHPLCKPATWDCRTCNRSTCVHACVYRACNASLILRLFTFCLIPSLPTLTSFLVHPLWPPSQFVHSGLIASLSTLTSFHLLASASSPVSTATSFLVCPLQPHSHSIYMYFRFIVLGVQYYSPEWATCTLYMYYFRSWRMCLMKPQQRAQLVGQCLLWVGEQVAEWHSQSCGQPLPIPQHEWAGFWWQSW